MKTPNYGSYLTADLATCVLCNTTQKKDRMACPVDESTCTDREACVARRIADAVTAERSRILDAVNQALGPYTKAAMQEDLSILTVTLDNASIRKLKRQAKRK